VQFARWLGSPELDDDDHPEIPRNFSQAFGLRRWSDCSIRLSFDDQMLAGINSFHLAGKSQAMRHQQ